MFFHHIYERGLAQASYLIGCQATRTALVIDPRRDIDVYLEIAQREKLVITMVTETHIHADYLSGAKELADRTGAELWLSDEGGPDWSYEFNHLSLKDGSILRLGNLNIEAMHTPGHTPEHLSFLVTDLPAGEVPVMLFSGDFVFVGDVGRPDLLEKAAGLRGTQEIGARQMFESLKRFKNLHDFIQVWPGHGAGSACGKALGAVPSSTVGYEKLTNWALRIQEESAFVEALLEGQPEPPGYFAAMKQWNKTGPVLLGSLPQPPQLSPAELSEWIGADGLIVDTRPRSLFAERHLQGSLHIQDNNAFSTWAGWMIPYDRPFVVVCDPSRIAEVTRKLVRIGLDRIRGYISSVEWTGAQMDSLQLVDCETVELERTKGRLNILDVRSSAEFAEDHIDGALHIHAGFLKDRLYEIPTGRPLVVVCESGDRSSLAASFLKKNGFKDVRNLSGGMTAWREKYSK